MPLDGHATPERNATPPDHETGHERHRPTPLCACGRVVSVRGKCVWCIHHPCQHARCEWTGSWEHDGDMYCEEHSLEVLRARRSA